MEATKTASMGYSSVSQTVLQNIRDPHRRCKGYTQNNKWHFAVLPLSH
jgi:hypothetical protein